MTLATRPTLLVLSVATFVILVNSTLHSRGYLTHDSMAYLRQAAFFLQGAGFYSLYGDDLQPRYFAVWPVGYPALIALTSLVTTLSPFWSSKLLNIVLVAAIVPILKPTFGRQTWVPSLFILSGGMLSTFSHTWSEGAFLIGTLLFTLLLTRFTSSATCANGIGLLGSMLALFFVRYVGAFALIVVALEACAMASRKDYRRARWLTAVNVAVFCTIAAYLINNYRLAGYLTGAPKRPPDDAPYHLFTDLALAQVSELNFVFDHLPAGAGALAIFLLVLLAPVLVGFACYRTVRPSFSGATVPPEQALVLKCASRHFLMTAVVYWLAIVGLRFSAEFDDFSYRLLIPSSFLFVLAVLSALLSSRPALFNHAARILAGLAIASVAYNAAYRPARMLLTHAEVFPAALTDIAMRYRDVPSGSVVLCGNEHLQYLRLDLIVVPGRGCDAVSQRLLETRSSTLPSGFSAIYRVSHDVPVQLAPGGTR